MAPSQRPTVTLAEVAQAAGVSVATVSKVLNGRADVATTTRATVEKALDRCGYKRPGAFWSRSAHIELAFYQLDNEWALEIIRGVESAAREAGVTVLLGESGTAWDSPAPEWIEGILERQPAGVVLVFSDLPPEYRHRLRSRGIPFVIIDPTGDAGLDDVPSVGSGNWLGGMTATRHLVSLGHTRIGVISGPESMMCSLARVDGYRSALGAAGIAVDDRLVRFSNFHVEGGEEHAGHLLSLPDPPTAIFAGSDMQALGVYEAAHRHGLRIPEDLSVVGYDDLPMARWTRPKLTTVHQPLFEMAAEATRMVLQLRGGEGEERQRLDFHTHLVVRESTAPPPRRG
jgi:LacI family xylobiose transport system transcriptional regulator